MREIVEQAAARSQRLKLVWPANDTWDLHRALEETSVDVVVTGPGDRDRPVRGFGPLLRDFPLLRVVSIGGGGSDSIQVMLVPNEEALGDITLDDLVAAIAGDDIPIEIDRRRAAPGD
jgi:hypothetical protein